MNFRIGSGPFEQRLFTIVHQSVNAILQRCSKARPKQFAMIFGAAARMPGEGGEEVMSHVETAQDNETETLRRLLTTTGQGARDFRLRKRALQKAYRDRQVARGRPQVLRQAPGNKLLVDQPFHSLDDPVCSNRNRVLASTARNCAKVKPRFGRLRIVPSVDPSDCREHFHGPSLQDRNSVHQQIGDRRWKPAERPLLG